MLQFLLMMLWYRVVNIKNILYVNRLRLTYVDDLLPLKQQEKEKINGDIA